MIVEYIKKSERRAILSSAIMILVAILLIIKPETMLSTSVLIFGISLLIDGAYSVILYIVMEREQKMYSYALVEGMVEIMAAMFILMNSNVLISVISIIVGCWIVIKSIMKIQFPINVKNYEGRSWVVILMSAIVTLALAVYIFIEPFNSVVSVTVVSGVFLLITGIVELVESIVMLIKLR